MMRSDFTADFFYSVLASLLVASRLLVDASLSQTG